MIMMEWKIREKGLQWWYSKCEDQPKHPQALGRSLSITRSSCILSISQYIEKPILGVEIF